MPVPVNMNVKKPETSMGRRLFAQGAQVIGGMYGGPAGAAAGGAIGGRIAGNDGSQSSGGGGMEGMMGGLMGGMGGGQAAPPPEPLQTGGSMPLPASNPDNSFTRRLASKTQDPQIGIQEGLNALTALPPDLRQQYTAPLVKAQMSMGGGRAGRNYTA